MEGRCIPAAGPTCCWLRGPRGLVRAFARLGVDLMRRTDSSDCVVVVVVVVATFRINDRNNLVIVTVKITI